MVTLHGDVSLAAGASAGSKETVNPKGMEWGEVHTVTPETVMNTKIPVGWHQSHKHIEGVIYINDIDQATKCFREQGVDYMPDDADHVVIPYFVASVKDSAGTLWTYTFTGAIMESYRAPHREEGFCKRVYRFKAYKVVEARPP